MKKKMWSGRFSSDTDSVVNSFNSSIAFDSRMYKQDIRGSIAHAEMLASQGIIPKEDSAKITEGLRRIAREIEDGTFGFDPEAEDIHMFVEARLTEMIGDAGKKLHTGRSRNDQVALDIKLYLKDDIIELTGLLVDFCKIILTSAEENIGTVMPGYTHLQRAQPVTYAHHMMAYVQMLLRDLSRLHDCMVRMDFSPLGCGALAGTTYPLDREGTAERLGFSGPVLNSMDGVSDRDHVIEYACALSIIMVHISRLSEEIILWSSAEFGFIELNDAFSTGSSIMPQKKNPDVAELSRGKSGRVFGDLMALLTIMKGLPLAYNKDMQEDKEAIFDASDTVKDCLKAFTGMIGTIKINKQVMLTAAAGGFTNATDLADYLVRKGLAFRDAHEVSGKIVAYCISKGLTLDQVPLDVYRRFTELADDDLFDAIDLLKCVNDRWLTGGPAFETVRGLVAASYKELERYSSKVV
jgi:argininosuccinate lyase